MKTYEERLPLIDAAIACDSFYGSYRLSAEPLIHTPLRDTPTKNMIYKNDTDEFVGYMDELEKRKAELQNKPSWDDAPDWANWLAQDGDG